MNTIRIALEHERNRDLLAEWLGEIYDVRAGDAVGVGSDGAPSSDVDLCLVDPAAFAASEDALRAWKESNDPVFAPVLLVSEEHLTEEFEPDRWSTIDGLYVVDDVVTMPIEKALLHRRLENLLERRRLSAQLARRYQRAEERFSSLFNGTPDPAFVVAGDALSYVNDALCSLCDVDRDAVVGEPLSALPALPAEGVAAIEELVDRTRDGEDPEPATLRLATPEGERFVEATVSDVAYGDTEGTVVVMRDVTERRRRERELAASERKFRAVFESANDALLIADDDGTCVDANPAACELFGVEKSGLLGRSIGDFAAEAYDFGEMWEQFLADGDMAGEFELERPDGESRLLEFTATTDVTPGRHLSALRDVTERREMEATLRRREARFRRIAANVDEVIWMADGDSPDLLYLSPSYEDLVGEAVPPEATLDLFSHLEHVHPEDREAVEEYLERFLADGVANDAEEEYSLSYRLQRCDGEVRWVEASAYPVVDDGEVARFVGLIDDITEMKRREAELASQNERLEEFAGIVSHDLRNPLQVIAGRAALLAEEHPDDEDVAAIEDATERMDRLIEDLLALAREGDSLDDLQATDLAVVAEEAWESVDASDATLSVDVAGTVAADRSRLRQLFENLFRNAVEHGGADVEVSVGHLDDDRAGFFVADDGPGIAPADRERVFESGYSTQIEGTGFGLAIVAEIAEAHGWEVSVTESAKGGARFEFADVETT